MSHRLRIVTPLAFVAILATQPVLGCASDPQSSGNGSSKRSNDADRIPGSAGIVKEGRGPVEYLADTDGTVYVQDVQREVTLVSHRVRRGEKVVVLPDEDRVLIDDRPIYEADLKRGNAHRIYLLPDAQFDRRTSSDARDDPLPPGVEKLDANRVATSVKVRAGQRFVFSPADDKIIVNGETVSTNNFSPKTAYRI